MPITPDTKNWTWVLERPCAECGFDSSAVAFADVPDLVRSNAVSWAEVLERENVTERPDSETWSALEYSAHVRDVFRIFKVRLEQMLEFDDPRFENWDQDATAEAERYNDQVRQRWHRNCPTPPRRSRMPSKPCQRVAANDGVSAVTDRRSPSNRWRPTSFTIRSITCTTSRRSQSPRTSSRVLLAPTECNESRVFRKLATNRRSSTRSPNTCRYPMKANGSLDCFWASGTRVSDS